MKKATRILNSGSKKTYEQLKFRVETKANYEDYKKVIKAVNKLRAQDIVESVEGHILPHNIGKLIILKNKPRVSQVYSTSRPGTKIYNIHSFGYIARVFHKDRILLRYPELYRFRPHRANIKVKIYDHMINGTKDYHKQSNYL